MKFFVGVLVVFNMVIPAAAQSSGGTNCSLSPAQIYQRKSPAVVSIRVTQINPYRLYNRVQRSLGSGFLFNGDAHVLTNSHVVFGAVNIVVTLDDGRSLRATILGADPIFDIAVLKIQEVVGATLPQLKLGDSSKIRVGEPVVAIGNPLGFNQTLTTGVISSVSRVLPETAFDLKRKLIQTDTALNPGNSGGPLLNQCGEVVGINTSIIKDAQNIGFAIPIDLVKAVLGQVTNQGRIIRPWIGFHGKLVDDEMLRFLRVPLRTGLIVEVVEPDSPAAKAGLQGGTLDVSIGGGELLVGGDIIKTINNISLTGSDALERAMQELKIGSQVSLVVFRRRQERGVSDKEFTVTFRLPERPLLPTDIPK